MAAPEIILGSLPGLDCGSCGSKTCVEFAALVACKPSEIRRCIHLKDITINGADPAGRCAQCGASCMTEVSNGRRWLDTLGRKYDFILDILPGDPGPRETILPHNPLITRELGIEKGDVLIGRPLGMSCGCPITHCGVVMEVDCRTGVIVWCVTGPLRARKETFKDLGYYIAEAYDGIVKDSRTDLRIGMRYFFLPHRCMLQWRHSGLVNFINRTPDGTAVRLEGLWIG